MEMLALVPPPIQQHDLDKSYHCFESYFFIYMNNWTVFRKTFGAVIPVASKMSFCFHLLIPILGFSLKE